MASTVTTAVESAPHPYIGERLARWRKGTAGPLMVVAVGTVPLLFLGLVADDLPRHDQVLLTLVNVGVLIAFLVDYLVGLSLATSRSAYVRGEKLALVIVVASALAFVPSVSVLGSLRLARLAPAVRAVVAVFRLLSEGDMSRKEARNTIRQRSLSFALGTTGMVWITAAVVFTMFEQVGVGQEIESFFDALWWSAATVTTVGYGDITPETAVGRMFGLLAMVVGITSFGVVTARLAAFLVSDD
jgi:voltage-gated potassium channel